MTNTAPDENFVHKIDPNQREDLRKVYLKIWASAIVAEIPEVAGDLKLKPKYVRELVGILETHADRDGNPFVHVNTKAGEGGNEGPHDWYSTFYTVDDHDDDEAQHWFDRHFAYEVVKDTGSKTSATKPKRDPNPADLPECKCGCGEICNRNRNYRPGHDARHAGQVARHIAKHDPSEEDRTTLLGFLPTRALQIKADNMADRLLKKDAVKAKNQTPEKLAKEMAADIAKVVMEKGTVKVGRWTYGAERNSTSGAVFYDKKGTTVVADDKVAAKFVPAEA